MRLFHYRRHLIILVFICFFTGLHLSVYAQAIQRRIDSAVALIPAAKEDTAKVWLLYSITCDYFFTDAAKGIGYGQQALSLATRLGFDRGIIKIHHAIGRCYAVRAVYPEALDHFQSALVKARETKDPMLPLLLVSLGAVYNEKGEFDNALKYLVQAREASEQAGFTDTSPLMNNIGVVYVKRKDYAMALNYYMQGIRQEEKKKKVDTLQLVCLYGNVGEVYLFKHDPLNALAYSFKALAIQRNKGNERSEAGILSIIGQTYLDAATGAMTGLPDSLADKKSNLLKAKYYLSWALTLARKIGRKDVVLEAYSGLAKTYKAGSDFKNALDHYGQYIALKDSLTDINKEKEFAKVEAEYLYLKKTDSLKYLNALKDKELKQGKLERNGGILLAALIGIISILLINRQKLKQVQKRKIAEEQARQQLDSFTKSIQEKNELIEKFQVELEKFNALPCVNELPEKDSLQILQSSVILTKEQWISFQAMFDKVHAGYASRVMNKYNDLTEAELRFIVLGKLGFNNKEMAAALGVSLEAIRITKYRILKKIPLPEGKTLDDLIHSV